MILKVIAVVVPFSIAAYLPTQTVRITTDSVNVSRAWRTGEIGGENGDLVMVTIDHPVYGKERIVKRIKCSGPGDILKIDKDFAYCNGRKFTDLLKFDSNGKPLKPFLYEGSTNGLLFLFGPNNPKSFDSRYFGLIDPNQTERLIKLW